MFLNLRTNKLFEMTQQNITDRHIDAFKSMLKKHSLKATPQRLAVHEAMLKLGHASADMVTEEIKANSTTKVTVASVYNILTGLALLGVYSHRLSANNKMYFDVNNYKHIHIYDRENHCYKDYFDEELINLVEEKLGKRKFKGFKVEDIDIQIIGRPTTRKKAASSI